MSYNRFTRQVIEALGIRNERLPREGLARKILPIVINGKEIIELPIYVKPKENSGYSHRLYAVCVCERHVPVGRLHQHFKQAKVHGGKGWRTSWR